MSSWGQINLVTSDGTKWPEMVELSKSEPNQPLPCVACHHQYYHACDHSFHILLLRLLSFTIKLYQPILSSHK